MRKEIYLCYSPQMVQQMTLLLNNAGVDMTNIQIVNAKEEKKYRYLIENQD
jgi:ferredoxin-NADP reductase